MAFYKCYDIARSVSKLAIFLKLLLRGRVFSNSWENLRTILRNSLLVALSKTDAHFNKTNNKSVLSIHV